MYNSVIHSGIFRFNFWRYGVWTEVIIDDRLPTKGGELIFAHNQNTQGEFWGPLIEKAHAKIHGSYQALVSGFANEALVDFTAGIAEQASLLKLEHPHRFFRTMKRAFRRGSLLTCSAPVAESTDSEAPDAIRSDGLVLGHVYSITGLLRDAIFTWLEIFDTLEMCHMSSDLVHGGKGKHKWNVACYHGEWVEGVNAGGCRAPPDEGT
ncbi:hypothetical protein NP493_537g01030 [Ridgeia piscesae]|uniref:Calpain catalytic domain-containing protein n=1 Tax=Ridgeia piscesae TaxID=27915 RepID=A0AAD9NQ41_RIDPI|nr:hypothetical protein NP493_537g01030 [Ridgeia piscesae]